MDYTMPQLDTLARALAAFQEACPLPPVADLLSYLREFCLYG